jgi:hypothetical protein
MWILFCLFMGYLYFIWQMSDKFICPSIDFIIYFVFDFLSYLYILNINHLSYDYLERFPPTLSLCWFCVCVCYTETFQSVTTLFVNSCFYVLSCFPAPFVEEAGLFYFIFCFVLFFQYMFVVPLLRIRCLYPCGLISEF